MKAETKETNKKVQVLMEFEGDEGLIFVWMDEEKAKHLEIQDRKLLRQICGVEKIAVFLIIAGFNFPNRASAAQKFKESSPQNSPVELRVVEYKPFPVTIVTSKENNIFEKVIPEDKQLIPFLENGKQNQITPQRRMVGEGIILQKSNLARNNYLEIKKELLIPQKVTRNFTKPPVTLKLRGGMTVGTIIEWGIEKAEIILLETQKVDNLTKLLLLANPAVWVGMLIVSYRLAVSKIAKLASQKELLPTVLNFVKNNPLKLIITGIVLLNTRSLFGLVTSEVSRTELISEINRLIDNVNLKIWGTPKICDSTNFIEKIKLLEKELQLFKYKAENRLKIISLKNSEIEMQKKEILEVRVDSRERILKIKDKMEKILKDSRLPENYESKAKEFEGPLIETNESSVEDKIIEKFEPKI